MSNSSTLTTVLHVYHYDISDPIQADGYKRLTAELKAARTPHKMHAIGDYYAQGKALKGPIALETDHLFDNQWNSAPTSDGGNGSRVFDWAEDAIFYNGHENTTIKRGHYLEQTDAMREIRATVHQCGYCGHAEPNGDLKFCESCLDSEYLKADDLKLLRMRAVKDRSKKIPELTDAERAELLPRYNEAQLHGSTDRGRKRLADQRRRIVKDLKTETYAATTKHDGLIWLLDHGLKIDNVIYYSHTDRFSFGWQKPCDASYVSALLDVISEFPFRYEIKCADGRTLENN